MAGTFAPQQAEKVRHKRHRPVSGDLVDLTPSEIAAEGRSYAVAVLAAALAAAVAEVHANPSLIEAAARRHTPKNGRGRRVVLALLRLAADQPDAVRAQLAVANAGGRAVWRDEPIGAGDRQRWVRANSAVRTGGLLLTRLGQGLCLRDGCQQQVDRRRLWCDPHRPAHDSERQAAQRAMRTLLNAAADALEL